MNLFLRKPAFTLLELLLVITIIGVLTSILVLNFSEVRQRQELTLAVDQALAMLQQARAEVNSGKVRRTVDAEGVETVAFLCEGAFFELNEAPLRVSGDYDRETERCTSFETELYGLSTKGAFVDVIAVEELALDSLYILYTPPDGNVVFYSDGEPLEGSAQVHFAHEADIDLDLSLFVSSQSNLVTLSLGSDEE